MKIFALCILFGLTGKAQLQATLGAGIGKQNAFPHGVVTLSADAKAWKHFVAEAETHLIGNTIPVQKGIKTGYEFLNKHQLSNPVSLFVNWYRLYHGPEDKQQNGWGYGVSLRWQFYTMNIGSALTRFYAEASYIKANNASHNINVADSQLLTLGISK
jgi:hypothetical protein